LVRWGWSSAPNRAIVDAVTIVQFIERNAADATPRIEAAEAAAHRVANLAIAARDAVPPAYVAAQAAAVIRAAAASALDLAASAGHAARSAAAVGATVCAFADAANTTIPSITQIQAIHRDFTRLTQRAQYENWDDNTPVPPEFFGPLWPEGAPPGWPTDLDPPRHTELELEIVASERVIDRIMEDEVVNLFNAINRYHIARGGSPLTLDELLPYLNPSLVPVGA